MFLADKFIERSRPHPRSQRRRFVHRRKIDIFLFEKVLHVGSYRARQFISSCRERCCRPDWEASSFPYRNRNFAGQTPYYLTDEFSRRDEYTPATLCWPRFDGGVWNCYCRFFSNRSVSLVVRRDHIRVARNRALFLAEP